MKNFGIVVKIYEREEVAMDMSAWRYVLQEVVSKTLKDSEGLPDDVICP